MTGWSFLVDLGREMGKEADISKFVSILEDNWIDPQSFGKISDEQLVQLGIPLGLIIKIRDLNSKQETEGKTDIPEKLENNDQPLRQKSDSDSLEIIYQPPSGLMDFPTACAGLEQYAAGDSPNIFIRQTSIKYIHSILSNLYVNPSLKHRNLRKTNPAINDYIISYPPVLDFLLSVGFKDSGTHFILNELFVSRMTDSLHFLAELQNSRFGLTIQALPKSSMFNPYTVGVLSAASDGSMAAFEKVTKRNQAELLTERQILEAKTEVLEKGPGAPVPRIPLNIVYTQYTPVTPTASTAPDVAEDNNSLTREELAHLKSVLDRSQTFQSKQKQEINVMKKKTKNNMTRVRVIFPNKDRVEFTVYSWELLREVKKIIRDEVLSDEVAEWTLEDRIPGSKLKDNKSLFSQGLTPTCSLYIKFLSTEVQDGFVRSTL